MTKMFEEYWRGNISGALEYFKSQPARGEFTLVIEGRKKDEMELWTEEDLLKAIEMERRQGKTARDISADLAEQSGWSRKKVYALVNRKDLQR
jgi:16S rRNA (cytidine1402-2'-O)-methyltransferase